MLALFSYWFFESAFRKPASRGEPSNEAPCELTRLGVRCQTWSPATTKPLSHSLYFSSTSGGMAEGVTRQTQQGA